MISNDNYAVTKSCLNSFLDHGNGRQPVKPYRNCIVAVDIHLYFVHFESSPSNVKNDTYRPSFGLKYNKKSLSNDQN